MTLAELLHHWHDFYLLAGTASATLVGLMFVAASIGANVFSEEHSAAMNAFLSPTVVHFSQIVVISLLITVPIHEWHTLGALLAVASLYGAGYSGRILMQIIVRQRFKVDLLDRVFYALLPLIGYLLLLTSSAMLLLHYPAAVGVIAAGVLLLMLAAIRNAWDMTVWIAIRSPINRPPGAPPRLPPAP